MSNYILYPVLLMVLNFALQNSFCHAQTANECVNSFNGNFHYPVSLLTVPGPHGESFPLAASYSAGIGMNQESSWVGLGWGISIGEISRTVNGVPDDWKAGITEEITAYTNGSSASATSTTTEYFGPVHYKDLYAHTQTADELKMDLYTSAKSITEGAPNEFPFQFPDYDHFHVSGPGIGGVMQPYMLEFANLYRSGDSEIGYENPAGHPSSYRKFTLSPEFRFKGEPGTKIRSYLTANDFWHDLPSADPDNWSAAEIDFVRPEELASPTTCTSNCPTGELWASYVVDYWTNAELDASPAPSGFMEWNSTIDRTTLEQDGIGAFRITDPSGMTYHYSLPVYTSNETVTQVELQPDHNDQEFDVMTDAENPVRIYKKNTPYASSWKLTAITGQDFVDNGDAIVGDGDQGYWINLDYGLWVDEFNWKVPYYGYNLDQRVTRATGFIVPDRDYVPTGTVTDGVTELYYPKSIKTSTHAAYFVYDVRLDGHSVSISSHITPQLALSRIVLVNRDNEDLFSSLANISTTDFANLGTVEDLDALVSEDHYITHKTSIERVSLQTVEFTQDYSLCEGVYNNIKAGVSPSSSYTKVAATKGDLPTDRDNELFQMIDEGGLQTGSVSNSGKLTLKEIQVYGDKHGLYAPSSEFSYVSNNPNYDHLRKDFFGYYKHNFDRWSIGGYLTSLNDEDTKVDAWSLNKVVTPIGGEFNITYESDVYDRVAYDADDNSKPIQPFHTFPIKDMQLDNGEATITLYDQDGYQYCTEFLANDDRILTAGMGAALSCGEPGAPLCTFTTSLEDLVISTVGSPTTHIQTEWLPNCEWDNYHYPCAYEQYYGLSEEENTMNGTAFLGFRLGWAKGGGLRVKEISVKETELDNEYKLRYTYTDGVLTTEPDRFSKSGFAVYVNGTITHDGTSLKRNYHGGDRHARGPAVGYSRVDYEIIGDNQESMGKSVRTFYNYVNDRQPTFHSYTYIDDSTPPVFDTRFYGIASVFEDNRFGQTLTELDFDANNVCIRKVEYEYEKVGHISECFYLPKVIVGESIDYRFFYLYNKSENQWLPKKVTTKIDDRVSTMEVQTRDALTGSPLKVKHTGQSDGIQTNETQLAYSVNANMGSKYLNGNYLNMLTSPSKVIHYAGSSTIRDAAVTAWATNLDLWEWDATNDRFFRNTSGYAKYVAQESRIYNGDSNSNNWRKVSENTLLDPLGRIIEQSDTRNRFSSLKYGYGNKYLVATCSDAPYQAFTHTSYESKFQPESSIYYFEGDVAMGSGIDMSTGVPAHTGTHYLKLSPGDNGSLFILQEDDDNGVQRGLEPGRTYHASVWVHISSPPHCGIRLELNGTWDGSEQTLIAEETRHEENGLILNGWKRLDVELEVPANYTAVGNGNRDLRVYLFSPRTSPSDSYFDDFRVRPIDGMIKGFVYDDRTGRILFGLNNDNVATRYEYDAAGNVLKMYSEEEEGFKKRFEVVRNFGRNH